MQVAGELRCVTRTRALSTPGSNVNLTETRQATPEEVQAHARLTAQAERHAEQHAEQQRRLTASQDAWLSANLHGDGLRLTRRPPGLGTASDPAGTTFPGRTPQGRAFTVRLTHGVHAYAADMAALAELAFHDAGGETISPYAALEVLLDATDEHAAGHRAARLVVRHTTEAWLEARTADIHLPLYDARDHALAAEADRRGLNPHRLRPAGFLRDPAVYRPRGLRPYTPTFTEAGSDRLLARVDGEFRVLEDTRAAGSPAGKPAARRPERT